MKTSSASQLSFEYAGGTAQLKEDVPAAQLVPSRAAYDPASASGELRVPNFGLAGPAYAINSRLAGRRVAALVPPEEHKQLLDERQALLDKQFAGSITKAESNKLTYIRWQLDRIEDAKYGQSLDVLEDAVTRYERLLHDLQMLQVQLMQQKLLRV